MKVVATLAVAALGIGVVGGIAGATDAGSPDRSGNANTCDPARRHAVGAEVVTYAHETGERSYNLTVPEGYDGKEKAPIILSFHGLGSNKDQQDSIGLPADAGERGYIVVTPQALPTALPLGEGGASVEVDFWNILPATDVSAAATTGQPVPQAPDDIGFVNDLVASLGRDFCIDANRVYLTGTSNGAAMAMEMACLFPRRFAAAAPVAGVNITECPAKQPISVVAVHGDADQAVIYDGGTVAGFEIGNPGVEERMAELAVIDGCAPKPTVDDASAAVTVRTWKKCARGSSVVLYTVLGGRHTWPTGEPFDATEAILDFFDTHDSGRRNQ